MLLEEAKKIKCDRCGEVDIEELFSALRACSNYFRFLGQGVSEETAQMLTDKTLKNHNKFG